MEQKEILQDMHDRLSVLVEAHDHAGARAFLKDRFTQLPEEVQGRVLAILLAEALEIEAVALDHTLVIQDESIAALKALEEMRVALQR